MAKGRWRVSEDQIAVEAYAVLIWSKPATRSYPKSELQRALVNASVYAHFLKYCLEFDDSPDLKTFRKGLLLVIKAVGIAKVADASKISRMSLYRSLAKGGNPRLQTLIAVTRALKLRLWVVEEDFIKSRGKLTRPKDLQHTWAAPNKR